MLRDDVHPRLCQMVGVNGNGLNGKVSCDYIACPSGTHNPLGHMYDSRACLPCLSDSTRYIGSKTCSPPKGASEEQSDLLTTVILALFTLFVVGFIMHREGRRAIHKYKTTSEEEVNEGENWMSEHVDASPDDIDALDAFCKETDTDRWLDIPKSEAKKMPHFLESQDSRRFHIDITTDKSSNMLNKNTSTQLENGAEDAWIDMPRII
eukprot:CAMPEP_0194399970 /NCGR_PEP_ID=MMETSP0174-20130528/126954_1 /TAXON_ID=216777 /ORGANISM="Proboscia alata, Strain PI-D3" /LENGTH=207 /DNA_ID=CAMNT_0039196433 /DNA_START=1147 /DNA_END=1770 /DNA_ORIENTATION=-